MAASIAKVFWDKSNRFLSKIHILKHSLSRNIPPLYLTDSVPNTDTLNISRQSWVPSVTSWFVPSQHKQIGPTQACQANSSHRHLSGSSQNASGSPSPPSRGRPLRLMDFPEIIWPHPLKSFRNFFFSFLMKGYYDQEYSRQNFLDGAEQAVCHVSQLISKGDFDSLEGLVSQEAIRQVRQHYHELSTQQRQFLAVNPKDIFFRFIYEIGMIFNDDTDQRFVEIMVVLQGVHGLAEAKQRMPASFQQEMEESAERTYICNYRFIREYTKGKEDQWTINVLNHFSPKDIVANTSIFRR